MLVLDIEHLARRKGEMRLVPFLVRSGMSLSRAKQVASGKKMRMLRDDTVRELCEIMECMPNDLFTWTGALKHPLARLRKSPVRRLQDVLIGKSAEELEVLWKEMEALDAERQPKEVVRGGTVWLNVRRLMEMRSAELPYRTLQRMGFSVMVARTLTGEERKDGQKYVKMRLLTLLCEKLAVEPNDLYDFTGPEGHVLDGLRKPAVKGLDELMKRMTPEEVRKLLG